MATPGGLGPGRRPPHITVNSGSGGNLLESMRSDGSMSSMPPTPGLQSRNLLHSPRSIYGSSTVHDSADMLLPPSKKPRAPPRPYYTDSPTESPNSSRPNSAMSSRRSSWGSDTGSGADDPRNPFMSPFDDSRAPSRAGSDEDINTQTVSEKYNIMPSPGLLLYPEEVERDDYLHNPDVKDEFDKCDIFSKRGMMNIGGLVCVTVGLLFLFIGYPALTFVRKTRNPGGGACGRNPDCLSNKVPLLVNQRVGLIDPDTPKTDDVQWKTDSNGKKLKLVFSDEFNKDGRTFYDGDDPYFMAMDFWYGVTQDLEWYDPDAVSTANGTLNLKFDAFQNHNLNYRSGMVQSWNKLCFKGGRMEASISLPGRGDIEGFWPGWWAMGNLGRPGYAATTDGLWPYSYWDKCDVGITPNQSAPDGLSLLPGMRLPACTCTGEDHPSPGKSRSAPEIDGIEASVGYIGPGHDRATGSASQSFQVAPFDIWYQPDYNFIEIYDTQTTGMNGYRGGVFQQALSGVTWLNNDWYDGNAYQTYGFEYTPGAKGEISWFVGDDYTFKVDHRSTKPNGNIGQRIVPEEPMTLILNFGMSNSFAQVMFPNLAKLMPATMRFDYIRIYQDPDAQSVTCDPPGYPTTEYIKNHREAYYNQNKTLWKQTEWGWPKNSFVNEC